MHWLAFATPRFALPPKRASQDENPGPSFPGLYAQYKSAFFVTFLTVTGYSSWLYVYYYRASSFSDMMYIRKTTRHREQRSLSLILSLHKLAQLPNSYTSAWNGVVNLIRDSYPAGHLRILLYAQQL